MTNPLAQAPDRRGSGIYDNLDRRRRAEEGRSEDPVDELVDDDGLDTGDDFISCHEDEGEATAAAEEAAAAAEDAADRELDRQMDLAMQPIPGRRYGPGAHARPTDPIASRPATLPLHPVWPTRGPPTSERTGRFRNRSVGTARPISLRHRHQPLKN